MTITLLLAGIFLCGCVSVESRPGRQKLGGRGRGSSSEDSDVTGQDVGPNVINKLIPLTVKALDDFCQGLSSGNIVNTDSSYDDVFTALESVCADLQTYIATSPPPPPNPGTRRRRRSPRGGGRGGSRGGSRGGESSSQDSTEEGDDLGSDDSDLTAAVTNLFGICEGLEIVLANMPANIPVGLAAILNNMGAVCVDAEDVRYPV